MQMHKAIFRLPDRVTVFFFFFFLAAINSCRVCILLHARGNGRWSKKQRQVRDNNTALLIGGGGDHAGIDVSQTYHSAVGHGALGFAGALGALPPLWVAVRRLADLEDVPGGSGAIFAPIRCRTHAYTSTNKTALTQNGFWSYFAPHLQRRKNVKKINK